MTWYLEIGALQEPFELPLSGPGRTRFVFNVVAVKRPSGTFLEELVEVLQTAGVATFASTLFCGLNAIVPDGPGPYIVLVETGGPAPLRTHNDATQASYARPTAQVSVHAATYQAAKAKAVAAYNALLAVRNVEVVP